MMKLSHTVTVARLSMTLYCLALLASACPAEQPASDTIFNWQELPTLNQPLEGAFLGSCGDAIVVAGGINATLSQYQDAIHVLSPGTNSWNSTHRLAQAAAYGAVVRWNDALILLGGRNDTGLLADVVILRWNADDSILSIENLPLLPTAGTHIAAAVLNNILYVVSDTNDNTSTNSWQLDLTTAPESAQWQMFHLPETWSTRIGPVMVTQLGGETDCLFIFGGKTPTGQPLCDGYRYNPSTHDRADHWTPMAAVPVQGNIFSGPIAAPAGQTHIVVTVPGNKNHATSTPLLWFYHTITNTWTAMGHMPANVMVEILQAGPTGPLSLEITVTGTVVRLSELIYQKAGFGFWNYLTLSGYMLVLILVGVYFSRRGKSTKDFFLAGQRIPWWAAGMSIYATGFSALSFMSTPAKVYATNWVYFLGSVALMPVIVFTIYCFVPFVCRLRVTTAYEYLEQRFNLPVRLFGSLVFILFQLGRMSIMMLLPALALATVTGIDVQFCILTMGVLCIIYTVIGGIEAIIWNDCLQVVVLTGAIIAILITVFIKIDGGLIGVLSMAQADAKLTAAYWTWDYTIASVWVVFFGNILSNFAPYVTDQSIIQRYLTTSDIKRSQQSLWFNFWFLIPNAFLFFLVGTAIYAFYKTNPQMLHPAIQTDAILPLFVVQNLPYGLCGLVIAGIFAASMSSLDSSMHAVTTSIVTDWVRRFKPSSSDRFYLILARCLSFLIGAFGTIMALVMAYLSIPSLLDVFFSLLGLLGGGIAGIFLLGLLTRRAHGMGVFVGALISAAVVFWCQTYTPMHFFLFGAIGLLSSMLTGYLLSLLLPTQGKDLSNLTIHTMKK